MAERTNKDLAIAEKIDERYERPRLWKVIILNDDFTPMEFVEDIAIRTFRKTQDEAERLTVAVHTLGAAVAGVYTHEIAETKLALVHQYAQAESHPLMLQMEPE